jgi:DNA (cytosine-5)-methyltransferase 1
VDMVTAGFPCQDISVAGKGAGLEGERSGLFYEIIRVAGIIRPRFILLENVPALLARGMGTVLGELAAIGYDAEWHCVSSAAVGAPHLRDRVFIVADATGERVEGNGAAGQQVAGVPPGTEISRRDCTGTGASEWPAESGLVRMAHGVSDRVDRIKGLGNAVVPAVAEYVARCFFCERESDEIENGETGEA